MGGGGGGGRGGGANCFLGKGSPEDMGWRYRLWLKEMWVFMGKTSEVG